jgi:hypothetical protein
VKRPWLSIVIPTIGRASLAHTLDSIDHQPEPLLQGVEVLVVGDSYQRTADLDQVKEHLATERQLGQYRYLEYDAGVHMVGQPQRSFGAKQARGDWVWFSQDDNIATADALAAIRAVTRSVDRQHALFFRWLAPWREVIWREPELRLENIDADCLVMPRRIASQVEWGMRYQGDFDAAVQASKLSDNEPVWCDDVVSIAQPHPGMYWWKLL